MNEHIFQNGKLFLLKIISCQSSFIRSFATELSVLPKRSKTYFILLFFSFSLRVTYQLMQKGETASYRGRDKNISDSSSNTMTPAMMNTIRTHTDRYIHVHQHIHVSCSLVVCLIFPFTSCFFITCLNPWTWTTEWRMNHKSFIFQLQERFLVTNVFPSAQLRDKRQFVFLYVCLSVLTGFGPPDKITGTSIMLFFCLSDFMCVLVCCLCVCLCLNGGSVVELCLQTRGNQP